MKNGLILLAVAVMVGFAFPQTSIANQSDNDLTIVMQQEVQYQEIAVEDIPDAVSEALGKDYSGFKVEKALKGDDGSYKIVVSKDDVKYALFYTEKGEIIKVEQSEAPM